MDPTLIAGAATAIGTALQTPGAGPSSAYGEVANRQGGNWNVNFGGTQTTSEGGMPSWIWMVAAGLVALWIVRR